MDAPVMPTAGGEPPCLISSCHKLADRISAILAEVFSPVQHPQIQAPLAHTAQNTSRRGPASAEFRAEAAYARVLSPLARSHSATCIRLVQFGAEGDHSGILKVWDLQNGGLPRPDPAPDSTDAVHTSGASPLMPVPALEDINSALVPPSALLILPQRGEARANTTARNGAGAGQRGDIGAREARAQCCKVCRAAFTCPESHDCQRRKRLY